MFLFKELVIWLRGCCGCSGLIVVVSIGGEEVVGVYGWVNVVFVGVVECNCVFEFL